MYDRLKTLLLLTILYLKNTYVFKVDSLEYQSCKRKLALLKDTFQ